MNHLEKKWRQKKILTLVEAGNMGQAREKLRIFENVMARVGLGGDFLGEYFKALSTVNGLQTYNEMNPPTAPLQSTQAPIGSETTPPPTSPESGLNTPINTPQETV